MPASTIAIYGNVPLQRAYCSECDSYAIVKNGILQCCGNPCDITPLKYERMSNPDAVRKAPSKSAQDKILQDQEDCCFYCGVRFGSVRHRDGKPFLIRIHWDHKLPYAYSQNNSNGNFVASCHVCNQMKSDKIFQTVDEAQIYLKNKRNSRKYDF